MQLVDLLPPYGRDTTDPATILRTLARYAGSGTSAVVVPDPENDRVLVTDSYALRAYVYDYADTLTEWFTTNRGRSTCPDYLDGLPVVLRSTKPVEFTPARPLKVSVKGLASMFPAPDEVATDYAPAASWDTEIGYGAGTKANPDIEYAVAVRDDGSRVKFNTGKLAFAGANVPGVSVLIPNGGKRFRPAVMVGSGGFWFSGLAMPVK